jgi:hypothetical protein
MRCVIADPPPQEDWFDVIQTPAARIELTSLPEVMPRVLPEGQAWDHDVDLTGARMEDRRAAGVRGVDP